MDVCVNNDIIPFIDTLLRFRGPYSLALRYTSCCAAVSERTVAAGGSLPSGTSSSRTAISHAPYDEEEALLNRGFSYVAGIDEAGEVLLQGRSWRGW